MGPRLYSSQTTAAPVTDQRIASGFPSGCNNSSCRNNSCNNSSCLHSSWLSNNSVINTSGLSSCLSNNNCNCSFSNNNLNDSCCSISCLNRSCNCLSSSRSNRSCLNSSWLNKICNLVISPFHTQPPQQCRSAHPRPRPHHPHPPNFRPPKKHSVDPTWQTKTTPIQLVTKNSWINSSSSSRQLSWTASWNPSAYP